MKKIAKNTLLSSAILGLALLPLGETYAVGANTTINATIASVISISNVATSTTSNTISLNLAPTAAGSDTQTANDVVSVSTNNATGYNLTLSMASSASNNSLISGANSIGATSGSFAAPAVLATNSWGYRVDSVGSFGTGTQTFAFVPFGSADTIKTVNTPASADKTTITYGIKVDATKPTGTYSNQVTYTATAK